MSQPVGSSPAVRALFLGGVSGDGCYEQGNLEQASQHFSAALKESWRDVNNLEPAGWWSERLARCELLQGRLFSAVEHAQESIKIRRDIAAREESFEVRWRLSGALLVLGDALTEQEQFTEARAHFGEGLAFAQSSDPIMQDYGSERAQDHLRKVANLRSSALLRRLGDSELRQGRPEEAFSLWHQALMILEELEAERPVRLEQMALWVRLAGVRERDPRVQAGLPLRELCLVEAHQALNWPVSMDERIALARFLDALASLGERLGTRTPWLREEAARLLAPLASSSLCPSLASILRG